MFGYSCEYFFINVNDAQKKVDELVRNAKKLDETLTDEECNEECGFSNFLKTYPEPDDKTQIREITIISRYYSETMCSENGTDYEILSDYIILQEIILEGIKSWLKK